MSTDQPVRAAGSHHFEPEVWHFGDGLLPFDVQWPLAFQESLVDLQNLPNPHQDTNRRQTGHNNHERRWQNEHADPTGWRNSSAGAEESGAGFLPFSRAHGIH